MPDALAVIFTLASPAFFAIAAAMALVCAAVAVVRRIVLPRGAMIMMAIGLACLCLAAGGLTWHRRDVGHVAVVVDLSPSTISAKYHDGAQLEARVRQLLGRTPFTLYQMTDSVTLAPSQSLTGLPMYANCRETKYAPPPAADAVVLFSDVQFALPKAGGAVVATAPTSPQTFVVIDSVLENPPDAAIERLDVHGDTVVATVRNAGADGSRRLTLLGTDVAGAPLAAGRFVVTAKLSGAAHEVIACFTSRDLWNGNDALAARVPPPQVAQKWWISARAAPSRDWVHIEPANAPADLPDYLGVAVIVLDNVSADEITETPRGRLQAYVRDLGGGMVILGGDRAFASGGYAGTPLEQLSPLASTPPKPAAQWLLLADSSGSMARTLGDNSRWHFAVKAIGDVIPRLPPDDTISVGNFAQSLRWWIAGKSVREAQAGFAYPKDFRPSGPTNLAAALRLIADTTDAALPTELLLITDAEAKIENVATLTAALAAKQVRVSVLATDKIAADDPLRIVADRTGGQIAGQSDPRKWAGELKALMRAASPPWLGRDAITVRPTDAGPRFSPQRAAPWNRTWLKRDATELAEGTAASGNERLPAIAAWNVGAGAVVAAAFTPSPALVDALVDRVAAPPRDPRFRVTHHAGRELRVTLDAIDKRAGAGAGAGSNPGGYMNHLAPRLEFSGDATRSSDAIAMPQTAPGRYEVTLPASPVGAFATVRVQGRVVERFVVAGRYPPEFEAIGNDRSAMEALARASGGGVIEPAHTSPIDFRWPTRAILLSAYLAAAGGALIVGGLVRWRI